MHGMNIKQMPLQRYLIMIMINFLISYYVCIRNNFFNLLETFLKNLFLVIKLCLYNNTIIIN